ncbi:unnamed protein product, partial [Protopolystoma xenopodis]
MTLQPVHLLKRSSQDAGRRLDRLRTFIKDCSFGLIRLTEDSIRQALIANQGTKPTHEVGADSEAKFSGDSAVDADVSGSGAARAFASLASSGVASGSASVNNTESLCGQVGKLTQENSALKTMLRLEEHRRKMVFNMMQEYLGNIRVYCRCRGIPHAPSCVEVRSSDAITLALGLSPAGLAAASGSGYAVGVTGLGISGAGGGSGSGGVGAVGGCGGSGGGVATEEYKFDRVFDVHATQADVYAEISTLVCSFLDGYNVCFLTYGGEASGKTYTLLGGLNGAPETQGIAQRALQTVLNEREARRAEWDCRLTVATIEVYNDTFIDLLSGETGLHLRVDLGLERMMDYLHTVPIQTERDVHDLLCVCRVRRRTGKTALNPTSSRSHLVLLIRLHSRSRLHDNEYCSVLALCDLAGFEDIIKADTLGDPTLAKEA